MFTYKIKLKPTKAQLKELDKRFKYALDLKYALTRKVATIRHKKLNHPLWKVAAKMTKAKVKKAEIKPLYKELDEIFKLKFFNTDKRELQTAPLSKMGLGKYATHFANGQGWTTLKGGISADAAAGVAEDVFKAYEKVMFQDGQKIKTSKLRLDKIYVGNKPNHFKDGVLSYNIGRGKEGFKLEIKAKMVGDNYEKEVFTNKRKTVSLQRTFANGSWNYYAILTFEGNPPIKSKSDYQVTGRVGIDPGTSSIAVVGDFEVDLKELAVSSKDEFLDKEIARLQRKLDRQRRANNPLRYDEKGRCLSYKKLIETGRIKAREKAPRWVWSKAMRKTHNEINNYKRIMKARRELAHKTLANEIMKLGDEFNYESMSYKGLAARAKETKVSEKTGKIQRKSRFGKSILNSAPSMLKSVLAYKATYLGKEFREVNTIKIKASQYNHIADEYIKKSLSTRTKLVGNSRVQRDLYAAFILQNVHADGETLDKVSIARKWDNFVDMHERKIDELIKSGNETLKSLGLDMLDSQTETTADAA